MIRQMVSLWKKYSFKDIETSRKSLKTNFLGYHLKCARSYFVSPYLQKYQNWDRGLCTVNIETNAVCNRKCSFCFYADRFPKRELGMMQEETYKKIIDDLSVMKFRGRLSPHSYGEPLLDKRLPALMEYTRKKLPFCKISIRTNGDFLNEDLLVTLLNKGVDHFLITNYDDEETPPLTALARKYPVPMTLRSYRDFRKIDRAGEIFRNGKAIAKVCLRPSSALVVNWKGNVVLCCQDFYQNHCFGNIREKSLWAIWNDPQFVEYRKQLLMGNREVSKICTHCDDPGKVPW
jgi:8-amino-3,8-dideoxy-alpha-D-manno-octulosonate transaminase